LATLAASPFAPLLVVAAFLLLELVAFPVTLLIAATAAAFGPWLGFIYAGTGALVSAVSTYAIGALIGQDALRGVLGRRMQHIRRSINRRGVLAIAAIRLVPIAPFALVNAAAGALRVGILDFLGGTVIGMTPGLVLMSALGHEITELLVRPTWQTVTILSVGVLAWIGVAIVAQKLVAQIRRSAS
jgi:uncharacterized membrane protein YdjX (TVP38/TMEM64 family)